MKSHVVGLDLGSVALKGVLLNCDGEVQRRVQKTASGNPADRLAELLRQLLDGTSGQVRVGVTGGGRTLLDGISGVVVANDLVCTASAVRLTHPDVRGVIEVGGHQSKWIRLAGSGDIESFAFNDQCAAGAGAFLEQQAGRLRMGVAEFSRIASGARQGASIAGRCSVFAKSDMIHLQQRGIPPDEIAYGLCLALARNFQAVLLRGTAMIAPAVLCGGGALDDGLYRAFCEVFSVTPTQLRRADRPQFLAAHGAALAAMAQEEEVDPGSLFGLQVGGKRPAGNGTTAVPLLAPAGETLPEPEICPEGLVEAWLGVDVGSVSTDFALVGKDGDVLDGIYLPTRGNPIAVVAEGLSILRSRVGDRLRVLGVGTTGSGRHLAGKLVGADVVKNEITCQLLGARHVCPDVDTILEIGGQDSKFVSVRDGRIADFVMNKICAAGTGSFLEEQAEALGIAIRGEFSALALASERPCDLGSQCTVFMDTEVVNARHRGVPLPDIAAGLALSVARNYIEKVVAGRTIGSNVVFQGGVASNKAVVAAFEQLLGRPVRVNPHNRISGAIGAALAARREGVGTSRFRGLAAAEEVVSRTFECTVCTNRCQVSRIAVGSEVAHFGDVCERYTAREAGGRSVPQTPDLFGEREELFELFSGGEPILGTVGMPRASAMLEMFPFWATFFRELGFRVVLSPNTTMATLEEGVRRITAETCLPIKLTYGHVAQLQQDGVDIVFLPSVLDLHEEEGTRSHMCPYVEAAGFMVSAFAGDVMMVPALSQADPPEKMVEVMARHLDYYGVSLDDVADALAAAHNAQDGVRVRLEQRGREVLATDFGIAFVILGKPYNLHDPFLNLNISRHLRRLGILPIPMDMIPSAGVELDAQGVDLLWRYNRDTLRTLVTTAGDSRLFPVVVSNFGCGPDAFGLKQFERLAGGRPSLVLEFDEHRGEAGLVTRLEAFIDEVSHHAGTEASRPVRLSPLPRTPAPGRFRDRRFVIPYFGDHAYAYAGALRSAGYETVLLPPPNGETIACGEDASSGKECHAYIITVGDLVRQVRSGLMRSGDVFFFPGTTLPCLLHQWGRGMELALERLGVEGVEILPVDTAGHKELMDFTTLVRLWGGLVSVDLLTRCRCQVRPYARDPAEVDRIVAAAVAAIPSGIEQGTLDEVLAKAGLALADVPRTGLPQLPVVGVAGDIYTRIHPFANHRLFERLEAVGLEVWPAPFLIDNIDFGLRKALVEGFYDGRYMESATAAMAFLRKEVEGWRIRFHLGQKLRHTEEPGYRETLDLVAPYLDGRTNEILVQNVAKMVDYARRGADGIINAISFHCMLGTISASMTERIRSDHEMIPLTTFVFSSTWGPDQDARLEAFAHQVKTFASRRREAAGMDKSYWQKLSHWWETR